jgi:hypothetical protein
MSENQARVARDLYDYEHDDVRSSGGRRRRPVADWGVGDDVFEQMPRRRFSRSVEGPARERRSVGHPDAQDRRVSGEAPLSGDRRRTIVIDRPEDLPSEIAAVTADRDIDDEPAPAGAIDRSGNGDHAEGAVPAAPPAQRRTVRIAGRPEGSLEATRARRHRPSRTAHERVGARPDRLAAWAVALGMLLILIALLTAL